VWDLFAEPGAAHTRAEAHDSLTRRDREIIQIMDTALDASPRNPSILDFRTAWRNRGLPAAELDEILRLNHITPPASPSPPPLPPPAPAPTEPDEPDAPSDTTLCDLRPRTCDQPDGR
jgi:hypothetical protein